MKEVSYSRFSLAIVAALEETNNWPKEERLTARAHVLSAVLYSGQVKALEIISKAVSVKPANYLCEAVRTGLSVNRKAMLRELQSLLDLVEAKHTPNKGTSPWNLSNALSDSQPASTAEKDAKQSR